jgi:hypothetical protein
MVVELYIFNALIRTSLPGIASAVAVHAFRGVAAADRAAVRRAATRHEEERLEVAMAVQATR